MNKILIVDDEASIRKLVRRILEEESYEVEEAENGAEAWEKFQQNQYSLVITDLKMPEMGGEDLVRNINEVSPVTMCIVLTGYGSLESARQVIGTGCKEYLLKPIQAPEMISLAVERCMESRKNLERYVLSQQLNTTRDEMLKVISDHITDPVYNIMQACDLITEKICKTDDEENITLLGDMRLNLNKLIELSASLDKSSSKT